MSGGNAGNVWGEITAAFNEAHKSNDDSLRVSTDNPATTTRGPDVGADRTQGALYPSELFALLACSKIIIERRRIYAVAAYTGLRQSELRALRAADVDLEHGFIHVRRQVRHTKASATKTSAGVRQVPIEPSILPLLMALVHARKTGSLLKMPSARNCARPVHDDLARAGLTREELVADDAHRKPFDFHGFRHTYLTHLAMKPDASMFMLAAAGHTDVKTSQRYVSAGNLLRKGSFGAPHAQLPAALVEHAIDGIVNRQAIVLSSVPERRSGKNQGSSSGEGGIRTRG